MHACSPPDRSDTSCASDTSCGSVASATTAPASTAPAADPAAITGFDWSPALSLDDPEMDATHEAFVVLIDRLLKAPDAAVPALLDEAIEHTRLHFLQETTAMQMTAFPPIHCHEREHSNIIEVMVKVREHVAAGDVAIARTLAAALAEWLTLHIDSMDRVLSLWVAQSRRAALAPAAQD
jgi:hemerythrin